MRYGLLGPVEVYDDEGVTPLPLGGPRQRAVLASLALRANETASIGYLKDAAWEDPPASPGSNIRTYVNGLRRRLRDDGTHPQVLITRPPGYLLRTRPGEIDIDAFEDLAARGTLAADDGEPRNAAQYYWQALDLWRGSPLEGLRAGPTLRAEATRLAERRLTVAEQYAQALLSLGQPAEAVDVLRPLAAQHPLHERLVSHLMHALYFAGFQTEALNIYRQTGRLLSEELGVTPGEELVAARASILAGDRALRSSQAATYERIPSTASAIAVNGRQRAALPRLVPRDIPEFTGRGAEQADLRNWVGHAVGALQTTASAPLVCVITGMPGIGKTRLAIRLAREITRDGHFDEVQLFADLHGVASGGRPHDPPGVLAGFLRMLGVPPEEIPDGAEDRAAFYRDKLHGRPTLVVLDDAADAGQVQPLLPGGPDSLVLITSRHNAFGLDGVRVLPLAPFTAEESVTLLKRVVGSGRVTAERKNAERIADLCGGLPLAVGLAAMRLRARPQWRLADLVARLTPAETRLGELSLGGRAVRMEFDASYDKLSPRQQRMLRLLAEAPGPGLEPHAAAAAARVGPREAEELLEQLLEECLVQQTSPGNYRLHELMRVYAERATAD